MEIENGALRKTSLIPGDSIVKIIQMEPDSTKQLPVKKSIIKLTDNETRERKHQLLAWLQKLCLPVTEDGENLKLGDVTIVPPYSVTDILAENVNIYSNIKKYIESMPNS